MIESTGLRERKKAETRRRIADVAAELFARHGYDAVTMLDVARAADVSDQTVYNHFPAKQDLVLDLAEEFRRAYHDAVRDRADGESPAAALLPLVRADVERYRTADLDVTHGEFVVQCVVSPVLRRFALEERERQAHVVAAAIVAGEPGVPQVVAQAHAAAIVAVVQVVHDEIGAAVLDRVRQGPRARRILRTLQIAFGSLDRCYDVLVAP